MWNCSFQQQWWRDVGREKPVESVNPMPANCVVSSKVQNMEDQVLRLCLIHMNLKKNPKAKDWSENLRLTNGPWSNVEVLLTWRSERVADAKATLSLYVPSTTKPRLKPTFHVVGRYFSGPLLHSSLIIEFKMVRKAGKEVSWRRENLSTWAKNQSFFGSLTPTVQTWTDWGCICVTIPEGIPSEPGKFYEAEIRIDWCQDSISMIWLWRKKNEEIERTIRPDYYLWVYHSSLTFRDCLRTTCWRTLD